MLDDRTKEYLNSKNEGTRRMYRRAFELFGKYTREERGEEISGNDLIQIVAQDRKRDIGDRQRPGVNILKGFFNWLREKAPKKRGKGQGFAPKTSHAHLSALTEFLSYNDLPINRKRLSLPRPTRKTVNEKMNIRKEQVRELVNHAKLARDKAVILCLWQSGMGVGDLLSLNVGDVKTENPGGGSLDNPPLLVKLVRKKAGVEYRTFFGKDACEAVKNYLAERERTVGKPKRQDPLFLQQRKNGSGEYKRLTPKATNMLFRRLVKRVGLVSEERMEEADINPARPHSLRGGFSSALKEEGVNQTIIDGLQGHRVSYDSAYHNFTDKQLRDLYKEHEDVLSIEQASIPREDEIEQAVRKHFGESGVERIMPEVKDKLEEQEERISELERELDRKRGFSEMVVEKIDEMNIEGSLDELIEKAVEKRVKEEMEKIRRKMFGEGEPA